MNGYEIEWKQVAYVLNGCPIGVCFIIDISKGMRMNGAQMNVVAAIEMS